MANRAFSPGPGGLRVQNTFIDIEAEVDDRKEKRTHSAPAHVGRHPNPRMRNEVSKVDKTYVDELMQRAASLTPKAGEQAAVSWGRRWLGCEFTIKIKKLGEKKLGVDVDLAGRTSILVESIHADGLLADWNRDHNDLEVKVYDKVVRINGVCGNAQNMVAEIGSAIDLEMTIQRQKLGLQLAAPSLSQLFDADRFSGDGYSDEDSASVYSGRAWSGNASTTHSAPHSDDDSSATQSTTRLLLTLEAAAEWDNVSRGEPEVHGLQDV
jgi:hypothetical protein